MNDFNASDYDRWLTTPPDDGHDYHDDLDLARHNALVADMAEQDADARPDWRIGTPCPACNDDGDCAECGTYATWEAYVNAARPAMTPTHHAIAALIAMHTPIGTRYRLVAVPGTELSDASLCATCYGDKRIATSWNFLLDAPIFTDCPDCHGTGKDVRGCEFCNVTHSPQNCPAIRAELMKEEPR